MDTITGSNPVLTTKKIKMKKIINKIKQQLDLSELKGDPLEDFAKLLRFLFIFTMLAITWLVIKGLLWIIL
jgi:hypothetical protein